MRILTLLMLQVALLEGPAGAALVDFYSGASLELAMMPMFGQTFPTTPMEKGLI